MKTSTGGRREVDESVTTIDPKKRKREAQSIRSKETNDRDWHRREKKKAKKVFWRPWRGGEKENGRGGIGMECAEGSRKPGRGGKEVDRPPQKKWQKERSPFPRLEKKTKIYWQWGRGGGRAKAVRERRCRRTTASGEKRGKREEARSVSSDRQ